MWERERELALNIVQNAVRISRAVQADISVHRKDKDDRSPVTVADLAVQALVSGRLKESFPNDPLMAEEAADELRRPDWAELRAAVVDQVLAVHPDDLDEDQILRWIDRGTERIDPQRRYWLLDPIDGTKGFLRKEQYAIALALVERGHILVGVLACPNLPASLSASPRKAEGKPTGQIYSAVRGGGAFCHPLGPDETLLTPRPLHVSDTENPAEALWCERVETSSRNKDRTGTMVDAAGILSTPFRIDSQAKYAVVARGEASLYLRHTLDPVYREKAWDHAAGVLMIEEAGGMVTDLFGKPLDFTRGRQLDANRGIVATNGRLHARVVAAVQQVLSEPETADDE